MKQILVLLWMLLAGGLMFGPCVLAGVIGSRLPKPWKAFMLTPMLSPLIGLALSVCYVAALYALIPKDWAMINPNVINMAFHRHASCLYHYRPPPLVS